MKAQTKHLWGALASGASPSLLLEPPPPSAAGRFIPLGDLLRLLGGTEHPLQLDVQFSLVTFLRSVWIASETEASRQENLDWGHCPEVCGRRPAPPSLI